MKLRSTFRLNKSVGTASFWSLTPTSPYKRKLWQQKGNLSAALTFLIFGMLCQVQPVIGQNTCASPFVIPSIPFSSGSVTTCGTGNDYAAGYASCVSSNYGGGEDYVYQLNVTTAPVTYTFTLGPSVSSSWKILSLHSGCPPASGNCLGGVANSTGSGSFNYAFVTNGTYYLIVDTWPTPTCAAFTLDITLPPPPPVNDNCSGAIAFPTIQSNGNCSTVTVNTASATGSADATCTGTEDDDVWYSFTVPVGATSVLYTNTSISGSTDRVLQIYSGSCPGTSIGCYDPESGTITGLVGGNTYLLRAYTWGSGVTSNFTICLQVTPPPPANDDCANAIDLTSSTSCVPVSGTTASATQSIPSITCNGFAATTALDVWYKFTAVNSSQTVTVVGDANFDGVIDIRSGACNGTNIACADATIAGGTEVATLTGLTIGQTYYVRLYDYSGTATFTICLTNPIPPVVLTCPTNTTAASCQTQAAVNTAFAAWLATASGTGGCSGVLTNDNTGAPSACGGSTTVTFTYTSTCAPLTTTCQATFTVAAPPTVVLTCPTNTTVASCQTQASVNSQFANWLATASASGGCNGVLTNNNTGAPSACGGSTTVTFTYTSSCTPTTTTCQATFTVAASPTVVLTCPTNTTAAACQAQADVDAAFSAWLATASASGGCNGVLSNNSTAAPSACGGSTTVTFTYTSACAPLTTTCQATFTVAAPPTVVLTCPVNTTVAAGQTQAAVNAQFATWLATASASGGCNGVLTNNNTGAPSAVDGGTATVTFTYTSTCAPLTTTCTATFTVATGTTVVLNCPINTTVAACQTQAAVNAQFATWLATVSASGGCNGVLTNNNTGAPAACGGSTTVTYTYTSTCAPVTTTCQATFTVAASPSVVLGCPTNTTVAACQTQAAVNTAFAAWLATATASGGCNGVLTNNNTGAPSACGGSTTVTFTYTSTCAPVTTTCQATFTVAAAPTVILTCPVPTTASACLTQAALTSAYNTWLATATASGGCNGVLTNNSPGAPTICNASATTITVTFTYTSSCAPTTTTCTSTFTVPAYPTFTLPVNGASQVACPALAVAPTVPTVVDGCGKTLTPSGPIITNNPNPVACEGTRTYAYTFTDCANHILTWSYVYTIERDPFTVPANGASQVACPAAAVAPTPPTVLSNCGETLTPTGPTITNVPNPLTCEGTRTYAYVYTDCEGNTATWSYVYTIERNDFTMPANGASQVACPAAIVQPTPPTVLSNCGETITPTGPVITNVPAAITCEGTRTYTWTYTDCEGNTHPWSHIITVERNPFTVPAGGSATVACPAQSNVQPVAPLVTSNCGETLTPVVSSSPTLGCEGNRIWNFTYTDCEGNTATWTFLYTVETLDFSVPANETATVNCASGIVEPTPPTVFDNCGNLLTPVGPVITKTSNNNSCEASRKYTWTYKDCEGNSHTWSKTFNINYTGDFFTYPDGEVSVGCLLYAQTGPVPPDIYGACGELIGYSGPVVAESVDASGCGGTRKFTYTYTDCGGHSHPWSFTYHAADNEPPVGDCSANANVTNLSCIEDVPCPTDFDFGPKIHELLATGNIYDVCSGSDLVVELDSWSELWQCSDPDGDGVNTFGRTFYFRIADQCGNEMPSLCGVTYSGVCQPLETFNQTEWGNEGGEPGASTPTATNDVQTIQTLLDMGPFKIGGANRSITLTNASCVLALVPGVGNPAVLGNCNQTDCSGGCNPSGPIGMKNTLATNTISLLLNMRFNVQYHGLTMQNIRNQGLGCIAIDPNIKVCDENGGCKLRLFESDATSHVFPYTLGGLLDLANLYLNGGLLLGGAESPLYASAINKSVANANAYWHNGQTPTTCAQNAGTNVNGTDGTPKASTSKSSGLLDGKGFSLAPNPAADEMSFKLAEMPEAKEVTLEVYNQLGQIVLSANYGMVSYVNERIDLSGIGGGMYIVSVKAGNQHYEQKLVIAKN